MLGSPTPQTALVESQKPDSPSYAFEHEAQKANVRRHANAEAQAQVMLRRLLAREPPAATFALLVQYALACHLNVEWYERSIREERVKLARQTRLATIVAVVLIVTTAVGSVALGHYGETSATVVLTHFAVLLSAAFAVLRLLSGATASKAVASLFWQASADLKEGLYHFEQAWRGKAIDDDDFRAALLVQIVQARVISQKERFDFFKLQKSPAEVLDGAATTLQTLLGRPASVADLVQARQAAELAEHGDVHSLARDARIASLRAEAARAAAKAKADTFGEKDDTPAAVKARQDLLAAEDALRAARVTWETYAAATP